MTSSLTFLTSPALSTLQARGKVSEIINGAIVHYRDDLDLQNLIDFGQKEVCGRGLHPPEDNDMSPLMDQAWGSWVLA